MNTTPTQASPLASTLGLVLVRFIVPLWVGMGAAMKLSERSPKLLPEHLRDLIEHIGVDLHLALAWFIAVEFAAVLVMVLIPRLARITAVCMLGIFCLVLLHEIFRGNVTNCGCLGSMSPPPWMMLAIDLLLLILVVALPVRPLRMMSQRSGWAVVSLGGMALGAFAFSRVLAGSEGVTMVLTPATTSVNQDSDPSLSSTIRLPSYFSLNTEELIGRPVADIEFFSWIPDLPTIPDQGRRYLILYSRSCEHCQELLLEHFSFDPPAMTTLIAIPENKDGFSVDGALDQPCLDCTEVELPLGVDWLITPPVVIAIEDGHVACAQEGEDAYDPQCLLWH